MRSARSCAASWQSTARPTRLQVNLAGEASKSGVAPEEIPAFLDLYPAIVGFSTMPPATDDPEQSRSFFRKLRELAEEHGLAELSMGTTQDYNVAVQEGATYIRIGSVLWRPGTRPTLGRS